MRDNPDEIVIADHPSGTAETPAESFEPARAQQRVWRAHL